MAFDLLPSLRPHARSATIYVRVSRKWEYRGGTDSGPIGHIDLVLIDEMGNSIYGEIPVTEVDTKGPLIQEGGVYIISRFRISNAKSAYRPVPAQFMVEFTCHTLIQPAKEDVSGFPLYAYNLTPFADLESRVGDTRSFTDVIGILVEVSETRMVHLANKPAPTLTRDIVLRDLSSYEVRATLWGQRAANFNIDGIYDQARAKPIVVLLVGSLVKTFQGQDYLSSNTASRWYFNPQILEAEPFYTSLQGQRIEIRHAAPSVQQLQALPNVATEYKTLEEMRAINAYDFPEPGYRCTVTIARLVPGVFWFASCSRCSKSCAQEAGTYKCRECSSTVFKFKYKLSFVASDGTAEAEMLCLGDLARRIVGKPVQQVMRSAMGPSGQFPPDIAAIVSLKFAFAVILTRESYYRAVKSYQVTSIVTSYGRQRVIPQTAPTAGISSTQRSGHAPAPVGSEAGHSDLAAYSGALDADLAPSIDAEGSVMPTPTLENTPPAALESAGASLTKSGPGESLGKGLHTSARRKLLLSADADVKANIDYDHVKRPKNKQSGRVTPDSNRDTSADESILNQQPAVISDSFSGEDSTPPQRIS